ncbi:MAG: hypothetical protein WAO55_06840 [Candidatus Manganitrophaceae bacterium]
MVFLLKAIAVITILSGAVQAIVPQFILRLIGAATTPSDQHFFAIIGMFMVLFGGALWQALQSRSSQPIVIFWASLQKFGAAVAVGLGVFKGIFSMLGLGVAAFDLLSGVIGIVYWYRIRN